MKHPGEIIKEKLDESRMTQKELAIRTGVTEKHVCTVINGDRNISPAFAKKLGYVFENSTYWQSIQAQYDQEQLRIQEENDIGKEEIGILKFLHEIMLYFIECGYMHNNCGDAQKVMQMRSLLNVSNLTAIPRITYNAAYRAQISKNAKVNPYVLFAWQRLCEKKVEGLEVKNTLNLQKLNENLTTMKNLMFGEINAGICKLQQILAECGIAFQVVKNFRGAPVQGFIKQLDMGRIILCLTIRRQRADTFWFTLFHEIAHIIHGDYEVRFVDFDSVQNQREESANQFAQDFLIPAAAYREFIQTATLSEWDSIADFAKRLHIEPFIVLGRLQKDGLLDWSDYADKVVKYSWA